VIVAAQLTKRFGARTAVADVSFQVERGEVVGFLGPNGAGKTTTLRLLAGVFPPTAGRVLVSGHDVTANPLAARRHLGYAPERPALYAEMTVRRQLAFGAGLRRSEPPGPSVDRAIALTGLADLAERRTGTLSKGMRQRVGLALALVGDPTALLLDEPLAGLDPAQSREMRDRIRGLADAGRGILVSSHALADIELIADRVVILHQGRILAVDRPATLARRLRPANCFEIEVSGAPAVLEQLLTGVPGVARVERLPAAEGSARCRVHATGPDDLRGQVAHRVVSLGWALHGLTPVETTLEDAFLDLVGKQAS
jgi:ABC-2 type transport system ATP-binding protein